MYAGSGDVVLVPVPASLTVIVLPYAWQIFTNWTYSIKNTRFAHL
jgi:hypothetical protein